MKTPTQKAHDVFSVIEPLNEEREPLFVLQAVLAEWERTNFGASPAVNNLLGAVEELGELAHAQLKSDQKIRGMADEVIALEKKGDAVADVVIYLMGYCTKNNLCFATLLFETANKVMKRNWVDNPETGGSVEP